MTTLVSNEVVIPGATIFDRVRVTGLGRSEARIDMELFGPFASAPRSAARALPYWKGAFTASGDGTYRTAPSQLRRAGFYTYRERLAGNGADQRHPGRVRRGRRDGARASAHPHRKG